MTLGLKFISCLNRKLFNLKKTSSCNKCILVRLWVNVFVSEGWVQGEITIHYNSMLIS